MTGQELRGVRANAMRRLTRVPHRETDAVLALYETAYRDDHHFAVRLFTALSDDGFNRVRDLAEAGAAMLLTADGDDPASREAGRAILPVRFAPYQIGRIDSMVRQRGRNRQSRGAVEDWLRALEGAPPRWEGAVLRSGRVMSNLYADNHVRPVPWAQAALFDRDLDRAQELTGLPIYGFPRLRAVRQLPHITSTLDRARLIASHRIPFVVAKSFVPKSQVTPELVVALIESMSPQEAANSAAWLRGTGLLRGEIRELYDNKIAQLATYDRASAGALEGRASVVGGDAETQEAIAAVREEMAAQAHIERVTLLATDKSSSMDRAISFAARLAANIAPYAGEMMEVVFDTVAHEVVSDDDSLSSKEAAYKRVRANGMTSIGSALQHALKRGFVPEQVVLITDMEENTAPTITNVLRGMEPGQRPHMIILSVGRRGGMWRQRVGDILAAIGGLTTIDELEVGSDTYTLDALLPLLTGPGVATMVDRVLDKYATLPTRTTIGDYQ